MSLAAVIRISEFHENPRNAVTSVYKNRDRFSELYIVYPGHDEEEALYEDFEEQRATMESAKITVKIVEALAEDAIQADYVVEINPYCDVKTGAMNMLQRASKKAHPTKTKFALASGIALPDFNLWYGYLLVANFFFFLWSRWEQRKMYYHTDVRMTAVTRNGRHKFISRKPLLLSYFWNPQSTAKIVPEDRTVSVVRPELRGSKFVQWSVNRQAYLRFSWFYWLPLPRLWMILFGLYWIMTFGSLTQGLRLALVVLRISPAPLISLISMTNIGLISGWLINWAVFVYSAAIYYSFPRQFQLVLLMPFYILTFPLMLVYFRSIGARNKW